MAAIVFSYDPSLLGTCKIHPNVIRCDEARPGRLFVLGKRFDVGPAEAPVQRRSSLERLADSSWLAYGARAESDQSASYPALVK
jgi:hypothetical protein